MWNRILDWGGHSVKAQTHRLSNKMWADWTLNSTIVRDATSRLKVGALHYEWYIGMQTCSKFWRCFCVTPWRCEETALALPQTEQVRQARIFGWVQRGIQKQQTACSNLVWRIPVDGTTPETRGICCMSFFHFWVCMWMQQMGRHSAPQF